jgi:UDP-galactopyranose mutase
MLQDLITERQFGRYDLWYYTPMALGISRNLQPDVVIFDCMDELSGFKGAPAEIKALEAELLDSAHVVFTGGISLYEAKRTQHRNVHCCPSSIDKEHFVQARNGLSEPEDQKTIPGPRIGFYGVVDERFDVDLLDELSVLRPGWHFVIIGPVVKINEGELPKAPNIHYLGKREYADLPRYLSGWDVAMLPFAHNSATRFISPTKTPEYLAAGRPVVSTSIRDVVRPYGEAGVISIADSPVEWLKALEFELQRADDRVWRSRVDEMLSKTSWDATWAYMSSAIESARADESAGGIVEDSRMGRNGSDASFSVSF